VLTPLAILARSHISYNANNVLREGLVDNTRETEATARKYFEAWTSGDFATVSALLAPDFTFAAGDMSIQGREAFLNASAFPPDAHTSMVAQAYQGETAFQLYDATRGSQTVRIVEQLTVRHGVITGSTFVTDRAAFMALFSQ
jgi:SnoaL-like domain